MSYATVLLLFCLTFTIWQQISGQTQQCEPLTVSMCQDFGYESTLLSENTTQQELDLAITTYSPLVSIQCSPELKEFLCSVYLPSCTDFNVTKPPCYELCESARKGCAPLLKQFGHDWPERFTCEGLPLQSKGESCEDGTFGISPQPSTTAATSVTTSVTKAPCTHRRCPKKRLEFEAVYSMKCRRNRFSKINRRLLMASLKANVDHLREICQDDCKVKRKPARIVCSIRELRVRWITDIEYPMSATTIEPNLLQNLTERIQRKKSMLLVYVASLKKRKFRFPDKNEDGSVVRPVLQPFCPDGYWYSSYKARCVKVEE